MKKLLPVLISLSITPTVFAQYVYNGGRAENEGLAVFLGFASIVGIGVFIKLNYEHYVHKTGEGEGSWWILLAALLSGYLSYTL